MEKISIVIPVFNSENTIGSLCDSLVGLYSGMFSLEIVLVNDNSKDNTDSICRALHEKYRGIITYIRLARNFGEHSAIMAGLNHAAGDYCVLMDDDLQNPPEEVFKLVEEIKKGYDIVYSSYREKKDSIFRNIGSKINDKVANIVLRKPSDLYMSSFKVINRFLVREIIQHTGPDPYIDAIIMRTTENIGKVEAVHRSRQFKKSGYTFKKLFSLWGNMVVSYSMWPLRFVGVMGVLMTLIGAGYGVYKAYDQTYYYGVKLTEYETLMSVNLMFRGATLFAVSVVGEYVGRTYLSLNKDPQFVIREVLPADRSKEQHRGV